MKKVAQFSSASTGHIARVYRDTEWNEYRVKFYRPDGEHLIGADYCTDDKTDAYDTAQSQVSRMPQQTA